MRFRFLLAILFFLTVLAACAPKQPAPVPTQPPPSATAPLEPTLTTAPTLTRTATPTTAATARLTATLALTPTLLSMGTADPNLVPESRRFTSANGMYSIIPPAEWVYSPFKIADATTDGWYPPGADPAIISLGTILLTTSLDITQMKNDWEKNLEAGFSDYSQVREDYLTSTAGLPYLRWELTYTAEGVPQRLVYAFYSTKSRSLILAYARPDAEDGAYDRLVDETFKTLWLKD